MLAYSNCHTTSSSDVEDAFYKITAAPDSTYHHPKSPTMPAYSNWHTTSSSDVEDAFHSITAAHEPTSPERTPSLTSFHYQPLAKNLPRDPKSISSSNDLPILSSNDLPIPSSNHFSTPIVTALSHYLNDPHREPAACFGPLTITEFHALEYQLWSHRYCYNPRTFTIEFKMTGIFHQAGVFWLSKGYHIMVEDNFVVAPRISARASMLLDPPPTGFYTVENLRFTCFTGSAWAGMSRVPDWCLYKDNPDPWLRKPCLVLEVGDSQPLARYSGFGKRENLRDRAVGWLTETRGVTKAVILVNLARRYGMVDTGNGQQQEWVTSIVVTVELWRMVSRSPTCVEEECFVVREEDRTETLQGGLTLLPEDIYDGPPPHNNVFVLEYAWLKEHLLRHWGEARREWAVML